MEKSGKPAIFLVFAEGCNLHGKLFHVMPTRPIIFLNFQDITSPPSTRKEKLQLHSSGTIETKRLKNKNGKLEDTEFPNRKESAFKPPPNGIFHIRFFL